MVGIYNLNVLQNFLIVSLSTETLMQKFSGNSTHFWLGGRWQLVISLMNATCKVLALELINFGVAISPDDARNFVQLSTQLCRVDWLGILINLYT